MDERINEIDQMLRQSVPAARDRSRSPSGNRRGFHNFTTFMRAASELSATSSSSSGSTAGVHFNELSFDLDDLMSSFLQSPRPSPTTQAQIEALTVVQVTEEHMATQCSICFDEFVLNEPKIRQMPCKHIYHENCLFPWLRINGNCPQCRSRLNGAEGDDLPSGRDATRYGESYQLIRKVIFNPCF